MEYARTWQDNLADTVHEQGWLPYLADQAKSATQIYPEAKLRGLVPEVGYIEGAGLNSNMKAAADYLLRIPNFEDFKSRVDPILNKLRQDNPSLAKQFADILVGTTSSDRFLGDTFTALAPLDIASVTKGGLTLSRNISLWNRSNQAVKDIVASAATAGQALPIRAAAAEGAGNASQAAAVRVVGKLTEPQTDFFRDVIDKLPSNLRLDLENLKTNPGSLSREQMTRLEDGYTKSADTIVQTAVEAARVNRTPIPLELENALNAYGTTIRDKFPGMEGAILDWKFVHEPVSNTHWTEVSLADLDGNLHSSPEVAENFAKFHEIQGYKVVPEEGMTMTAKPVYVSGKEGVKLKTPAVVQQGLGYKIVVVKPYKETDDMVRKYMIERDSAGNFTGAGASSVSTSKI